MVYTENGYTTHFQKQQITKLKLDVEQTIRIPNHAENENYGSSQAAKGGRE